MTDKTPNDEYLPSTHATSDALPTQQVPEAIPIEPAFDDTFLKKDTTDELRIISFYLPSRSEPVVSREKMITIGRRDPKRNITPTIDLTEERGAELGVSRLHAEISFQKGRYVIKDMGSSNGSWVNNSKLTAYQPHPLETGDQIRFGQLAVLVHISLPHPKIQSTAEKLVGTLTDTDYTFGLVSFRKPSVVQPQGGFAPVLLETLGNILKAVESVYYILREVQEREAKGFSILRIRTEPMEGAILIDVKGGKDILDFLTHKMPEYVKILEGGSAVSMSSTIEATIKASNVDQYDSIPEKVAELAIQELVFRFLHEKRTDYVQQLAPHLEDIISSVLDLVPANT